MVYTGEMLAVLLALQCAEEVEPLRMVICSDSSSSLFTLQHSHSENRKDLLSIEIQQGLFSVQLKGLSAVFIWLPAHSRVMGNELADKKAKEATK